MRIHGYLSQGDVYTILRLLGRTNSSGLLRLHTAEVEATLAVQGGRVLRASICTGPALGQALVMSGAVEPSAIEEALMMQRQLPQRKPVGSILVGLGVIGKNRVSAALTDGIRDVIGTTAAWQTGSYEFEPSADSDSDGIFGGVAIQTLVPSFESRRSVPRGH